VLQTNLTGCVLACRQIARHMIDRGRGCILVVGSTVVCAPSYAGAAYRASKTALRSYTETLAIELAPFGIRVNMLTPGPFPTMLVGDLPAEQRVAAAREVPLGQREGRLAEVGPAAVFLLSDQLASYITGAELFVDGGLHLRPLYIGPTETVRALNQ
jgi:NAD(P)-dependent dehydrogenase (short-subunit alcohol dehydrogenase family)